jgi:hypothetical protein
MAMSDSERICITQFEQKEYDSFAFENEDIPGETSWVPTCKFEVKYLARV